MSGQSMTLQVFGTIPFHKSNYESRSKTDVHIPSGGCPARELAIELELPLEEIEAVFINCETCDLDHMIRPGDRVAFIPKELLRQDPVLLGFFGAGQ